MRLSQSSVSITTLNHTVNLCSADATFMMAYNVKQKFSIPVREQRGGVLLLRRDECLKCHIGLPGGGRPDGGTNHADLQGDFGLAAK